MNSSLQSCALLTCCLLFGQPATAQLGQLEYRYDGTASFERFGEGLTGLGDLNADGSDEFAYQAGGQAGVASSQVVIRSGVDGSILFQLAEFNTKVFAAGDLNNDGHADFALARLGSAQVEVRSGIDASNLLSISGSTGFGFGENLVAVGDITADGVIDYAVSAAGTSEVALYSGATGGLLNTLSGQSAASLFGNRLAPAGDLNQDGVPDLFVAEPRRDVQGMTRAGRIALLSLADGSLIHAWNGSQPFQFLGEYTLSSGDLDGDGLQDVAFTTESQLEVSVYSGANFGLLDSFIAPPRALDFGRDLSCAGDQNGDGYADVVISAPSSDLFGNTNAGAIYVYSGRTGEEIDRIEGEVASALLMLNSSQADVNGDGYSDIFARSSEDVLGLTTPGRVRVYLGGKNPLMSVTSLVAGGLAQVDITQCAPNASVIFAYSLTGPGPISTPFGFAHVAQPYSQISLQADAAGNVTFNQPVPAGTMGVNVWFHAVDFTSELLLNPLALTIG